ncbi:MAG: hypothetical protein IJZ83_10085 [Clostridia bacterium]|nr:hypothetical protein [Clostridia bacterium]
MKFSKTYKRIISFLLVIVTLSAALIGCKKDKEDTKETESSVPSLMIVSEGQSEYMILRSVNADSTERQAALDLRNAIKEKCGVTLEIVDDSQASDKKAICVGVVSRQAVGDIAEKLGYNDYIISVSGEDLVICGGCSDKTKEAVERFIGDYLSEERTTLEIRADLLIEEYLTEKNVTVKIGDRFLKDYAVIVADGVAQAVSYDMEALHNYCVDNFGFGLKIFNSKSAATDCEIVVGKNASRDIPTELETLLAECSDNEGVIYFAEGKIWLTGNSDAAIREAILTFKEVYLDSNKAANGVLNVSTEDKICEFSDKEYTVMSFNLLFEKIDGWCGTPEERTEAVLTHIRTVSPDILGAQECTEYWYGALCEALGDEYGVVGEMNDPKGQKWRNPIFYRKDKFELVETKTLWLTKTPTIKSKYTGSVQYRILTYAVLKDKETGKTFAHANTHLGFEAAEKPHHWKYLIELLDKINYPIVLTGDFNAVRTEVYHTQIREAGYWNSIDMTSDCVTDSTLDFVFVTPESVHVIKHYSMPRTVNIGGVDMRPSDHPAVVTNFCLR